MRKPVKFDKGFISLIIWTYIRQSQVHLDLESSVCWWCAEKVHRWTRSFFVSHSGLICMRYESSSSWSWIVSLLVWFAGEKSMQKRCTGDPVPSSSLIRASILLSTRTPCWWRFNNPVSSLVWSLMIWPVLVWPQMLLHFYCSWMWIWEKGFLSQFLSRCFGFFLVWRAWLECWGDWCRWVL